jgi:hypothetical protein
MAVILLSYFGTMVTALAALMFVLNTALSSSMLQHHTRPQPYPMPAIAQAAAPEMAQAAGPDTSSKSVSMSVAADADGASAKTKQALSQKSRAIKVAREQRRQQRLAAAQRPDQNTTMALGYAEERPQRLAAAKIFNAFDSRRF